MATVDHTVFESLSRTVGDAEAALLAEAVLADIPRLLAAVESAEPHSLAHAAHRLASVACVVGGTELVKKATALEDAARAGTPVDVGQVAADLRQTAEATTAEIRGMVQTVARAESS